MQVRALFDLLIGQENSNDNTTESATLLAERYELQDQYYLRNVLSLIRVYVNYYDANAQSTMMDIETTLEVRTLLRAMNDAAEGIRRVTGLSNILAHVLAASAHGDIFFSLSTTEAVVSAQAPGTATPRPLRAEMLSGFMKSLGEYWFNETGSVPSAEFGGPELSYASVPDTAASFIVEALDACGCEYSNEEIAAEFADLLEYLHGSEAKGGTFQ